MPSHKYTFSTSWIAVWTGGHNFFTPAEGKYFLSDSTEHTQFGGTDYLWIPAAKSERLRCEKQIGQEEDKEKVKTG